jgi:hypothetical protein
MRTAVEPVETIHSACRIAMQYTRHLVLKPFDAHVGPVAAVAGFDAAISSSESRDAEPKFAVCGSAGKTAKKKKQEGFRSERAQRTQTLGGGNGSRKKGQLGSQKIGQSMGGDLMSQREVNRRFGWSRHAITKLGLR